MKKSKDTSPKTTALQKQHLNHSEDTKAVPETMEKAEPFSIYSSEEQNQLILEHCLVRNELLLPCLECCFQWTLHGILGGALSLGNEVFKRLPFDLHGSWNWQLLSKTVLSLQHVAFAFLVLLSRIQTHPNQSSLHPLKMFPPTCLQNEVDPLPVKLFPALHDGPKVIVKRPWFYTMSQKSLKKWLGPKFGKINHISLLLFPPQFATGFPEKQS